MEGAADIAATTACEVAVHDGFGGSTTAAVGVGLGDSSIAIVGEGGGATGTAEATTDAVVAMVQGYTAATVTVAVTIGATVAVDTHDRLWMGRRWCVFFGRSGSVLGGFFHRLFFLHS